MLRGNRRKSMKKLVMLAALAANSLGAPVSVAVADEVPAYDVRKSCKVDLQSYSTAQTNSAVSRTSKARARRWSVSGRNSHLKRRSRCSQVVGSVAGPQSYLELLTCL